MSLTNPSKVELAFLALFNEPTDKAHDTSKTSKEAKQRREGARREYEARAGYKIPSAELAARIEAAQRIVWVPHCYVLFVRQATCRSCLSTERVLDIPRLFLQQRRADRRDDSNPYLYTPVKEIEYGNLPRRLVVNPVVVPYCLSCFEGAKCLKELSSPEVVTELRIDELEARVETLQMQEQSPGPDETPSVSSASASPSPSNSKQEESAGSPSETSFGSVCGEREFAPRATVDE